MSTTLEILQRFLVSNKHYFKDLETEDQITNDPWRGYFQIIAVEVNHLEMWQRRVQQRMHRFESMKDGLVSYSGLEESRRSTTQGNNIGLLTNMTVAYLPFNLAAALFSLSGRTPAGHIWLYWAILSLVLGLATFYFAFGRRLMEHWTQKQAGNKPKPADKLDA